MEERNYALERWGKAREEMRENIGYRWESAQDWRAEPTIERKTESEDFGGREERHSINLPKDSEHQGQWCIRGEVKDRREVCGEIAIFK